MATLILTVDTEKNTIKVTADGKTIKDVRRVNVYMVDPEEYGDDNDGDEEVRFEIMSSNNSEDLNTMQILTKAGVKYSTSDDKENLKSAIRKYLWKDESIS